MKLLRCNSQMRLQGLKDQLCNPRYVDTAKSLGIRTKFYYTIREVQQ